MSNYIIPTFTGKLFDLLEPTEDMICIEDIAHHLSLMNRFCGATKFPYSVAYHSIFVSNNLSDNLKLEGLLHDAEEAYIHDLTAPFKELIRSAYDEDWKDIYSITANTISLLIGDKFNLYSDEESFGYGHKEVDNVDKIIGASEIKELLPEFVESNWLYPYQNLQIICLGIQNLSAENVEELFLKEYKKWKR